MSASECYINKLPKDIIGIIYRYLYDDVPRLLYRYVLKFKNRREPRNNYLSLVGVKDPSLLKSTMCKICCRNFNETVCVWTRSTKDIIGLLANPRNNDLCTHLIKSQDISGVWNKSFKNKHRFSIINGVVYHLAVGEYPNNNRYRLVPYFQSDHCWQDLAMRFLRNMNINENTRELDECVRKQSQGQPRIKHDPGCTIS